MALKYCTKCGNKLDEKTGECPNCGNKGKKIEDVDDVERRAFAGKRETQITLKKILGYVAGLLAVVALLLPLAAAFVYRDTSLVTTGGGIVTTYTNLYSFIFGGDFGKTVAVQGASGSSYGSLDGPVALVLIGWILLVLGTLGVVAAIGLGCVKKARLGNLVFLGSALVLIIAAVLFFVSKTALVTAALGKDVANQIMGSVSLGFGPIGTGIFVLLSGASCVGSAILKK